MKAKIVGIKRLDFEGEDGKSVNLHQYNVVFNDATDTDMEGQSVAKVSWNVNARGAAPAHKTGDVIEILYNKSGKLTYVIE